MTLPLPEADPCYFCEIIAGASDAWNVIEQNELTLTVLNGRQFEVGQCIVVSARHAPTILDLSEREQAAVIVGARRAAEILVHAYKPDGLLLYQNNGTGSGQEVPHFHMHIVPRRSESDWGFGPPHIAMLEREYSQENDHRVATEMKLQTVEKIRRHYDNYND